MSDGQDEGLTPVRTLTADAKQKLTVFLDALREDVNG